MANLLVAGRPDLLAGDCVERLISEGYRLEWVSTLHAAVARFLETPPTLLLVDFRFDGGRAHELLQALKSCMQKTNVPILLVIGLDDLTGIDWPQLPVDDFIVAPFVADRLLARLRLAELRVARVFDNNPLSRLPGNTSILKAIQAGLDSNSDVAVCYVDIDNFKPYNDRYGFARGDEVIILVARLIVNAVEEIALAGSFVGHVGGDDFVFIVAADKVEQVCGRIIANFDAVRNMFLDAADINRGHFAGSDRQGNPTRFDLPSLSVAVVPTGGQRYSHYGEVSSAASQMKRYVKQFPGSNYKIDRRGTPSI